MKAEGMEALWARHAKVAAATRAAVQALGLEVFAERPNNALTVITVPAGIDGSGTLKAMEKGYGFKLADGQDDMKGKIWRLSHMGYVDAFDVLGAIAALELTLAKGGFKLTVGAGVAAFQKAMAG
jgi:serine---pyruvate transaminase